MERILLVEDDGQITASLSAFLQSEGFSVESATGETRARQLVEQTAPGLLLVDVQLAEGSGFGVCAYARSRGLPVIFLTASGDESSVVLGLDMGADDYIAKPFSVREVLARVRSVLRRTAEAPAEQETVAFEGLGMDLRRKVCTLDGKELALTKKEFEILALLLAHRGVIFSREEILRRIWSDEVIVLDRTVDVNITRLRRKIDPYGGHIVTRLGYGYGFEE